MEKRVECAKLKGKRVWQTVTKLWGVCKEKGVKVGRANIESRKGKKDKVESGKRRS